MSVRVGLHNIKVEVAELGWESAQRYAASALLPAARCGRRQQGVTVLHHEQVAVEVDPLGIGPEMRLIAWVVVPVGVSLSPAIGKAGRVRVSAEVVRVLSGLTAQNASLWPSRPLCMANSFPHLAHDPSAELVGGALHLSPGGRKHRVVGIE